MGLAKFRDIFLIFLEPAEGRERLISKPARRAMRVGKGAHMKRTVVALAACVLATAMYSCDPIVESDPAAYIPDIAESVLAYDMNKSLEVSVVDSSEAAGASTLDFVSRALEDALPSGKTEEDLGDGRIRITRTWTSWNGIGMKSVMTRMKKPAELDTRWPEDIVDTGATEELFAGDLINPVATARLTITWRKEETNIYVYSILREGERLKANGDFVTTYTEWDSSLRIMVRKVEYLRVGENVAAKTIRYTYSYNGTEVVPAEIRFTVDGIEGYGLILSVADPRVLELYKNMDDDPEEERFMRIERVRNTETGVLETTRIRYNADGTEQARNMVRVRVRVENGVVTVVRELPNGRYFRITITETADGYSIDRNGTVYTVVVNSDGSLLITCASGT